jgi:lipopolysaccharide transport system ATP-binding protein
MAAVRNLCYKGVVLSNGNIEYIGNINDAVDHYLINQNISKKIIDCLNTSTNDKIRITKIRINNTTDYISTITKFQKTLQFEIEGEANNVENAEICLIFRNNEGSAMALYSMSENDELQRINGNFSFTKNILLPPQLHHGTLKIDLHIHQPNVAYYLKANECCILNIEGYIPGSGQIRSLDSGLITLGEL